MNLHLNLSISFPAHSVARATLIENTRIFPMLSLKQKPIFTKIMFFCQQPHLIQQSVCVILICNWIYVCSL